MAEAAADLQTSTMPRVAGSAREVQDALRAARRCRRLFGVVARRPALAAIALRGVIRTRNTAKRLLRPVSRAWPPELSRLNINFEEERQHETLFHDTYRVRPEIFLDLMEHLQVPEELRCQNRGGKFTGETALLVLLARLGAMGAGHGLGLKLRMNPKRISKVCGVMVRWLSERWGHVVMTGLKDDRLQLYVDSISEVSGVYIPIFGFLDTTLRGCRRVKYGQRAIYSGHKKKHGMKYQIVAVPDGLITCMTGPVQGRRGDSRILEESQLEDVIHLLQQRTGVNYIIYADAAYAESATLMTGYKKHQRAADANKEWLSKSLNGPRTSVEWAFGLVQKYFPWVDDVSANNIAVTPVGLYYQAAVLLTNCITCATGAAGSFYPYFKIDPPSLPEYLS